MSIYQEKLAAFLKKSTKKAVEAIENFDADKFVNDADQFLDGVVEKTGELVDKAKDLTMEDVQNMSKSAVKKVRNFDPNDFNLDVPATIPKVLAVSSNVIDRDAFLQEALGEYISGEAMQIAIEKDTRQAGIRRKLVDTIANQIISGEVNKASGISVAAGSTWATLPADIIQYFGFVLRLVQKLAYLYGYKSFELSTEEGETIDDSTLRALTALIGIMFGATEEVKDIGSKMGKLTVAKGVVAPIPVLGGVLSGGMTYATLRPYAERLKNVLSEQFEKGGKLTV
ncbi:MAG: hypothetical protein ILO43_00840 [Clostridia bacterium]|nr:hypothetical protein [Clostridia bacterium]